MTDASTVGLATAFAAGIVSFVSPCVLPLVPGYISYVAGQSLHDANAQISHSVRVTAIVMSAFFVLGFSAVFIALGASATALGQFLLQYRYQANIIGGIVIVMFGLFMLGLLRHVAWFHRDLRFHPRVGGGHPASAFLVGVAFGFGWTPCIGPILGAILTVSAVQSSLQGSIGLLTAYTLGLGLPFVLSAVFTHELIGHLKLLRHAGRPLQVATGIIMIVFGVVMATGQLTAVATWLLELFPALGQIG